MQRTKGATYFECNEDVLAFKLQGKCENELQSNTATLLI